MRQPVAILFDNFGPYHWARVSAAARRMPVIAIEVCEQTAEYAWERTLTEPVERKTLLSAGEGDGASASRKTIRTRLRQVLDEIAPGAVAIAGWSTTASLAALEWCSQRDVPAIVMSETTSWDEQRSHLKEWIKRRLVMLFSAAITGGSAHKQYLKQLGMRAEQISGGYDVIDNDYFAQGAREARGQAGEVRKKYGLPEHYFLASCRFIPKKNLPLLLEAYASYRKGSEARVQKPEISQSAFEPWNLVLLGDGPLKPDLCRLISDLGLQDSVSLPGFKQYDELPKYYALAEAFIHASTSEQWGLVVNEAMACGLPVLVSDRCGCAADLVSEGHNGLVFDPYDKEAIARAMAIMSDMALEDRARMGAAGHSHIASYSPEAFASGMVQATQRALTHSRPRLRLGDLTLLRMLARR